ncbi:hypothetical protein NXS19_001030 [Fusarium pseudograminearum]|nr:hypothetical protein NXS19_001030 [Fusarium pseudograminearum]
MDELRFRSQQSPRGNDPAMHSFVSPPRNASRMQPPKPTLTSELTTIDLAFPAASPPTLDYNAMQKVQLIEKKKMEYERIREQRRRFELEMQKLDQQQRREALELAQMEEEVGRMGGHQSEPTTPPEYRDNSGFPTFLSRPSRYSMSSLTSPPGFFNRAVRSGSQLASPQSGIRQARFGFDDTTTQMPSRSVPTTRRNSDDEKEEAVRQDPSSHRSGNSINRYSMPVTRSRTGLYDVGLDQTNTTRFLFGDEDSNALGHSIPDENFPTLVRRDDQMQNLSSINGTSNIVSDLVGLASRPASLRHSIDLKYISENAIETGSLMSPPGNGNMATPLSYRARSLRMMSQLSRAQEVRPPRPTPTPSSISTITMPASAEFLPVPFIAVTVVKFLLTTLLSAVNNLATLPSSLLCRPVPLPLDLAPQLPPRHLWATLQLVPLP